MGKQETPPPPVTGALSGSTGPNSRMNKMTTSLGFTSVKKPLKKSVNKSNTQIISDELLKETENRTGPGSIYDESTYATVPADN